ncbi:MAG: type III-B CRISPR module-associated protein Cmr3 [Candidatus Alkanophagales archaeon]|nr:MAG: type III-B CRISPR module-associated protein Cmr3 [Candidatus Alkanophagales archaeon]
MASVSELLRFFVEPLDVLIFRSSRPFVAGEDHVAKPSIANPSTFAGALKTKILASFCSRMGIEMGELQRKGDEAGFEEKVKKLCEENKQLREVLEIVGHPCVSSIPKLQLKAVFFAEDGGKELLPLPNDVRVERSGGDLVIRVLEVKEGLLEGLFDGKRIEFLAEREVERKRAAGGASFLRAAALRFYLLREFEKLEFEMLRKMLRKPPYKEERRTGIELERGRKRAEDRKLYTAEFWRFEGGCGFTLWLEDAGIGIPEGLLRLGGEGRPAYLRELGRLDFRSWGLDTSEILERINEERRLKLYLVTPAIFEAGWKPDVRRIGKMLGGAELELVSALPGKPVYLGGYDVARNKEKPLRRGVNAGAVYFFKVRGRVEEEKVRLPLNVSDYESEAGLGAAFVGVW